MRGKENMKQLCNFFFRITPAYAGKSWIPITQFFNIQDHPRLCGEKLSSIMKRAWEIGITPAYAGKRFSVFMLSPPFLDHPRLCGEKENTDRRKIFEVGSPPPMRGKACDKRKFRSGIRITPAYAGKSFSNVTGFFKEQDHPRLCGEKLAFLSESYTIPGSPPPMRGKGTGLVFNAGNIRITPAYAGKSVAQAALNLIMRDHPRLCGEKTKKIPKQRYFFHQPASFSFSLQYT